MRLSIHVRVLVLLACVLPASTFFCPHSSVCRRATATQLSSSSSSTENQVSTTTPHPKSQKYLGLLTFDLDDSLYPLERVINEANEAFVRAMNNYGFTGRHKTYIIWNCFMG